jgi:hypothetical protein
MFLSLWLGIASAFSFIVAPAVFKVLPSRTLAGDVVNRVLGSTEIIGIATAVILMVLLLTAVRERTRAFWFEFAAYASMALTMMASKFVVSRYLHELREKYGDALSGLPITHSGGEAFAEFHLFSETLMGVNLLLTLALVVWLVRRKAEPQAAATTTPMGAKWESQHA